MAQVNRFATLCLIHPDGYVEIFAPPNVDCLIARVPEAPTRALEASAEEWAYGRLPARYKRLVDLWCPRMVGTARPLTAAAMLASVQVDRDIETLDEIARDCSGELSGTQ